MKKLIICLLAISYAGVALSNLKENAGQPNTGGKPVGGPQEAGSPKAGAPQAGDPQAGAPQAGDPQAGAPQAGDPQARGPYYPGGPHAGVQDPTPEKKK